MSEGRVQKTQQAVKSPGSFQRGLGKLFARSHLY